MKNVSILIYLFFFALLFACQNSSKRKTIKTIDPSYRMFSEDRLTNYNKYFAFSKHGEKYYTIDNNSISKDSLDRINLDSVKHVFASSRFLNISSETFQAYTYAYFKKNQFKPSFLNVTLYSDDLLGLNLGSSIHGDMIADFYNVKDGKLISSHRKSKFEGSYFLGSRANNLDFEKMRMVLKIDTFLFEKIFLLSEIDEREIATEKENK